MNNERYSFFNISIFFVSLVVQKRHLAKVNDVDATDTSNPNLNYGLVVDCGSSGSRVFVYCWPRHNGNPHELLDIRQMRDQHRKPVVMKIKPGTIRAIQSINQSIRYLEEMTCSLFNNKQFFFF